MPIRGNGNYKHKHVFLALCSVLFFFVAYTAVASAADIYVPDNYTKIQWAVDNATVGDTIIVRDSTYTENVDVNTPHLTIRSENGSDFTIVQAANSNDHVFEVTADYVNISGFTVKGATGSYKAGIFLNSTDHCNISDSNAVNNDIGIKVFYSSNNNTITNSTIYYGNFYNSNYNTITNNTFRSHLAVISSNYNKIANNTFNGSNLKLVFESRYNRITNNTFTKGGLVVYFDVFRDYTNTVKNNTVNGKPLFYQEDVSDYEVEDAGQVILLDCFNITVKNLDLSNTSVGVQLWKTSHSKIINNTVNSNDEEGIWLQSSNFNTLTNNTINSNNGFCGILLEYSSYNILTNNTVNANDFGIYLDGGYPGPSSYNTITNNIISNNYDTGIFLWVSTVGSSSNHNKITNNTVDSNGCGIYLCSSSNTNHIYLNNFVDNSQNVHSQSDSTNIWNSTSPITYVYNSKTYENYMGNYWDDYEGVDADGDGIGDASYAILHDNNDSYPLMVPFENYFAPTENIFDTGPSKNPYPSIMGTHNGTITPNQTITVSKLYTYPCTGTGGHSGYVRIWNKTGTIVERNWTGYSGDWHNITFPTPFTLEAGKEYNYTIHTGSYPQIHHNKTLIVPDGEITCTKFTDANGRVYYDWIPAIRLE
jgi:parallel beta-helix repeat protein